MWLKLYQSASWKHLKIIGWIYPRVERQYRSAITFEGIIVLSTASQSYRKSLFPIKMFKRIVSPAFPASICLAIFALHSARNTACDNKCRIVQCDLVGKPKHVVVSTLSQVVSQCFNRCEILFCSGVWALTPEWFQGFPFMVTQETSRDKEAIHWIR